MHTELYKLDEADRQGLETVVNAWEQQYRDPRRAWELLQTLPAMACLAPAVRAAASFQMALAALRTLPAERADPLLEQAQAWARDSGHGLAVWRVEVASAMRQILRGQAEVAVDGLQRLAEHTPGEASASDRWLVLNQLSIGLAMAADLDRALPVYYRALDAARDCALPMLVATTGCNLGGYQTDLHNPQEALPLLEEALGIAVQQASVRQCGFRSVALKRSVQSVKARSFMN